MYSALVVEGERVILPSGRVGVVVGRGDEWRVEVLPEDAVDEEDTVLVPAKYLKRVCGPQPAEVELGA